MEAYNACITTVNEQDAIIETALETRNRASRAAYELIGCVSEREEEKTLITKSALKQLKERVRRPRKSLVLS
jgi:hypothetical protein